MKTILFNFTGLLFIISFSCSSISEENDVNLPEKLKNIPTGIEVKHSKEIVYAIENNKDIEKYGKYKWQYETSVKPINEDLKIIEFGAYLWNGQEWIFRSIYNRPFNHEEFVKWYSCEQEYLQKGVTCTDSNNWSKSDKLNREKIKTLWYYIGENKKGKKYIGTAIVTKVGELKQ